MAHLAELDVEEPETRAVLADDVVVYTYSDSAYRYLGQGLSQVTGGGYALTGWYDKTESEGGRIRVIVAVPQ